MLEEKPCLWDVFDKAYTKRDVKEIAYTEIANSLDTNIESIKAKINGLRAQHRREVAKVNSGVVRVQINKSYYRISRWLKGCLIGLHDPFFSDQKNLQLYTKSKNNIRFIMMW